MKTRTISAILMFAIIFPFFYVKIVHGYNKPLILLALLLAITATVELIDMKEKRKSLPDIIDPIMYLSVIFIAFQAIILEEFFKRPALEFNLLPLLVIVLSLLMVCYKRFTVKDVGFTLYGIFYIGLSFLGLVHFLIHDMSVLLYLIIVSISTDTFAYFSGFLFGKRKLIPEISPKKTVEGAIGGTLMATILGTLFLMLKTNFGYSITIGIGMTVLFSILAQFGDLIASKMKREYDVKDFGNLFPGHGGVLDRLDSILFIALTCFYLVQLFPNLFQ